MTDDTFTAFSDGLDMLADRAGELQSQSLDEAKTKTWLIAPFFKNLGYDISEPSVAVPEYTADWGPKAGEKVDYALLDSDGEPQILVECKSLRTTLQRNDASQLSRYFGVTDAHVGVLTNGVKYEFYLDTVKQNVMDEKPFFEFDLVDSDETDRRAIHRLARRTDGSFDMEGFKREVTTAKFKRGAIRIFEGWLASPDEELSRLLNNRLEVVVEGNLGELARDLFVEFVDNQIGKAKPGPSGSSGDDAIRRAPASIATESSGSMPLAQRSESRPLMEWDGMPARVIFPNGTSAPIYKQYELVVAVTLWLIDQGHLTREALPIRKGNRKTYIVSDAPFHPSGKKMKQAREAHWAVIETNYSLTGNIENTEFIIEYAHTDPTKFKVTSL